MKTIAVWATAFVMVFGLILSWLAFSPAFFEMVGWVDEEVGDNLTGEGKEAYDAVKLSGTNIIRIIGPAAAVSVVVWALLSMSKKERYTGQYRR